MNNDQAEEQAIGSEPGGPAGQELASRTAGGGTVARATGGLRLQVPSGGAREYRLAQLDDYAKIRRGAFPHRAPLHLSLRARVSDAALPGTWGFGLWNDPFGLSLGFGGTSLRIPALPNAAWFFHASPENHLSFGEGPGHGFLAQAFRSPARSVALLPGVALRLPFSRRKARAALAKIIHEEAARLEVDPREWHRYELDWEAEGCRFRVDGEPVLETAVSACPPLGLVLWIDNQYAAWKPDGTLAWGLQAGEQAWLEITALRLE